LLSISEGIHMTKFVILAGLFILTEVLVSFLFAVIAQVFYHKIGFDFKSIFKGVMERLFLFISLANGYVEGLTFFSALKLATRLRHQDDRSDMDGFNDYYLLGNLLSVVVVMGYVYAFKHFDIIPLFQFFSKK